MSTGTLLIVTLIALLLISSVVRGLFKAILWIAVIAIASVFIVRFTGLL